MQKQSSSKSLSILALTSVCIGLSLLFRENHIVKSQVNELLNERIAEGSKIKGPYTVRSGTPANALLNGQQPGLITRSGSKCLTFEETLDDLVASSTQVFVTMPAKAAGSSMKSFTDKCVGILSGVSGHSNVSINQPDKVMEKVFTADYKLQSLITAHVFRDTSVIRLMENIPRTGLIIHMHRDETDRLMSAIKMVVMAATCKKLSNGETGDEDRCVLSERYVIDHIIKQRKHEIGMGEADVMTCDFYDAIEENRPRMVFINYKQADKLQKILSKYHCPELLDAERIHANVAANKELEVFLTLEKDGTEVPLQEWLMNKRDMLEYTFALREKQSCRGKSLNMQDDLLTCEDEVLQVTRDTSF